MHEKTNFLNVNAAAAINRTSMLIDPVWYWARSINEVYVISVKYFCVDYFLVLFVSVVFQFAKNFCRHSDETSLLWSREMLLKCSGDTLVYTRWHSQICWLQQIQNTILCMISFPSKIELTNTRKDVCKVKNQFDTHHSERYRFRFHVMIRHWNSVFFVFFLQQQYV